MTSRDRQICDKLLSEIAVAGELIQGFTVDTFIGDERTVRAVAMTLINIGELVKNLTPELKAAHPEIPWRAISGMRDITAHKYQTLRKEDVYNTCVTDLPMFERQLAKLVDEGQ
ncbi:MAG: HepT-like ribonuclease domain-containing protein [bacterium]